LGHKFGTIVFAKRVESAAVAQLVERIHGKDEVSGSSPLGGSIDLSWMMSAMTESSAFLRTESQVRLSEIVALSATQRIENETCKGRYSSGQRGQTVNLLASAYGGSNPSRPTRNSPQIIQLLCYGASAARQRTKQYASSLLSPCLVSELSEKNFYSIIEHDLVMKYVHIRCSNLFG
jgi:hypothetical protein